MELSERIKKFFVGHGVDPNDVTVEDSGHYVRLYSLYDVVSNHYEVPFGSANDRTALRTFEQVCQRNSDMIMRHPEDFKMFYVGGFDNKTGNLYFEDKPLFVANAIDVVRKTPLQQQTETSAV